MILILKLLLPFENIKNYFVLDNGFKIYILDSCNGFLGIIIWFLILLFFDIKRLKYYFLGALFLYFVNLLRVVFVVFLSNINASYFDLAHNVLGRILYVVCFLCALWYVKTTSSHSY
ncbi:exosortase/archaeosortase family protein [Caminibacter pacificus]|jgi:exosortase/archaeosortase family protein|uniref:Exosortase/archaeosortase family protein n=1 Tax=Caminibacter pacificus TaxID=1424653 RepID=A0ABX5TJV4_9BACT|nr:exosortase/archaeosortase family protein [Caminibacter pacificus]NPA87527.1 exosortase/archaeosortase family protein [Campylobacterota bacterium]QCI27407.1 exosortase/archaeosortase family protein [Caminibacter pacificus]